jgi:hypothetical protein
MGLIDNKQAIADRANGDDRARERGKAMSDALRGDLAKKKETTRKASDPHGKIPDRAPINGVDPQTQEERDEREAIRKAETGRKMSDLIRGRRVRGAGEKTTNEILAEQVRGHRR